MERRISKVSLACLLLASPGFSSIAYAQFCSTCPLTGFSIGGGIGSINFQNDAQTTFRDTNVNGSASGQTSVFGFKGNIFAGYTAAFGDFFLLGAELGLNFVNQNEVTLKSISNPHSVTTGTDTLGPGIGIITLDTALNNRITAHRNVFEPTLDLKPGVLINRNMMFYARLGMAYNDIQVTNKSNYNANGTVDTVIFAPSFRVLSQAKTAASFRKKQDNNVLAWRTGVGMTGLITPSLGFSTDYVYTFYNTQHVNQSANSNQVVCDFIEGCTVDPNGRYRTSSTSRVSDQEILLQLVYYFQC